MNLQDVIYLSLAALIGIPALGFWLRALGGPCKSHLDVTSPAEHRCEAAEYKRKFGAQP